MDYTAEQKSTIEYLINRGKSVHKQLVVCKDSLEVERLQDELNYIKMELHDTLNAEAMFRAHIRVAKEHIEAAEALRDKWCKGERSW